MLLRDVLAWGQAASRRCCLCLNGVYTRAKHQSAPHYSTSSAEIFVNAGDVQANLIIVARAECCNARGEGELCTAYGRHCRLAASLQARTLD